MFVITNNLNIVKSDLFNLNSIIIKSWYNLDILSLI